MIQTRQISIVDAIVSLFQSLSSDAQKLVMEKLLSKTTKGKTKKFKLSSLKGKVSKMTSEEIDKQIKSLRNEWDRGF